jgi:hypothetical protein
MVVDLPFFSFNTRSRYRSSTLRRAHPSTLYRTYASVSTRDYTGRETFRPQRHLILQRVALWVIRADPAYNVYDTRRQSGGVLGFFLTTCESSLVAQTYTDMTQGATTQTIVKVGG